MQTPRLRQRRERGRRHQQQTFNKCFFSSLSLISSYVGIIIYTFKGIYEDSTTHQGETSQSVQGARAERALGGQAQARACPQTARRWQKWRKPEPKRRPTRHTGEAGSASGSELPGQKLKGEPKGQIGPRWGTQSEAGEILCHHSVTVTVYQGATRVRGLESYKICALTKKRNKSRNQEQLRIQKNLQRFGRLSNISKQLMGQKRNCR